MSRIRMASAGNYADIEKADLEDYHKEELQKDDQVNYAYSPFHRASRNLPYGRIVMPLAVLVRGSRLTQR